MDQRAHAEPGVAGWSPSWTYRLPVPDWLGLGLGGGGDSVCARGVQLGGIDGSRGREQDVSRNVGQSQ